LKTFGEHTIDGTLEWVYYGDFFAYIVVQHWRSLLRRVSFAYALYSVRVCGASQIECKLFGNVRGHCSENYRTHVLLFSRHTEVFSPQECRRRMYSCELITTCSRTHWFSWSIDSRDQRFNADENDSWKKKYTLYEITTTPYGPYNNIIAVS